MGEAMACRKAFDVDLVACLLDAGRPEWTEFREHYPRCPECAAEVRTWTELQSSLAPPHPAPEELIRFESRAKDLPADARTAIAAHIATCRSCRDELRALRAFDPRTMAPAVEPAKPRRRWWRGVGRVVLHPAVAYGIALALAIPVLFPAVGRRVEQEMVALRADRSVEPTPVENRTRLHRKQAVTPTSVPYETAPQQYRAEGDVPVNHAGGNVAPSAPAAPAPAAAPPAPAFDTLALAKTGDASERLRESASPDEARRAKTPRDEWPVVVLIPDHEVVLPAPAAGLVLRLAPPRSQPAVPPGLAWLRVRDAAGRRELREQQFGSPGSNAEIRVPAGWLEPGGYRADILLGDDARPITMARFRIEE
jgi:hypothetical protein